MKDKNTLLFLVIVAVLVAVAFLVFILNTNTKTQTPTGAASATGTAQATSSSVLSPSSSTTPTPDWHLYENIDYGFSMNFSDAWKGYQASKVSDPTGISLARYDFLLKTSDSNFAANAGEAPAITIYVVYKSSWDELSKGTVKWIELGRSEKYVYAYTTWQSTPSDLQEITEKEIANTLKTFKIGV